jgi:hypothetical protein
MRRLTAGLACVAAAALIAPATASTAHATSKPAQPNPITALGGRLAAGTGVTYRSTTRVNDTAVATTTAAFRLNRSGVAAGDLTTRLSVKPAALGENAALAVRPERTITIGDRTYLNSASFRKQLASSHPSIVPENGPKVALLDDPLPADRPWIETRNGPVTGTLGLFGQLINPTEPATLRTLLAQRPAKRQEKRTKTTIYRGAVTIGELHRVSPWLRDTLLVKPDARLARTKVDWELHVGPDGLPRRILSAWQPSALGLGKQRFVVDSRFAWGANVRVTPPDADRVLQLGTGEIEVKSPLVSR